MKAAEHVVSESKAAARIRVAAIEAFAENGYAGTTTRDIAARLGLSAAAMYPHYKSKEELLFVIAYEGHQITLAWLADVDDPAAPPAQRLRAVVGELARIHATYYSRSRVVEYEMASLTPEHRRAVSRLRRKVVRMVRDIVDAGAADGSFAVPDAEGVSLAIVSLCVDVCRWFPGGTYTQPQSVEKLYPDLAIRLVGATNQS